MKTDTIAAIATALSDSGIGIIRISGPDAVEIADRIYRSKGGSAKLKDAKSHTIHYGFIVDGKSGEVLDEVLVSVMLAPKTYTAEDTVEIHCHGGVFIMQRILEEVLSAGAVNAEPGEFTKRAFLNGRIDLSEAEAVMDVIHSQSELALKTSLSQLKGSISKKIAGIRAKVLYEIAFIESALDDPEHISLEEYPERLDGTVSGLIEEVKALLSSADSGRIIKEGIKTVIVGKPNAGKSSLLNYLLGEDKAIVTEIAGTTRDVLEETVRINGIPLCIIDTAGIRSTEDIVEKIGVEKAKKYASSADLILYVVDSSVPLDESDREIMELIGLKKYIVLFNKTDLLPVVYEDVLAEELGIERSCIVKTSIKHETGIDLLEKKIKDLFFEGDIAFHNEVYITNIRHKELLQDTLQSLMLVKKSLDDRMPEDFYSIDLMNAYRSLGFILGEEVGDDLVDEIFSKFCMGK